MTLPVAVLRGARGGHGPQEIFESNKRKQSLVFDATSKMLHMTFLLDVPKANHIRLSLQLASELKGIQMQCLVNLPK